MLLSKGICPQFPRAVFQIFNFVLVRDKNEPFLSLKPTKILRTLCGINACIKTRKEKDANFRRARLRWRSECKSVMADFGASSFI